MKMELQLQTPGLPGVCVFWESRSFPSLLMEDDYHSAGNNDVQQIRRSTGAVLQSTLYIKLRCL